MFVRRRVSSGLLIAATAVAGLAAPASTETARGRTAPPPDCGIPTVDERCEKWEFVYDDPSMYETSDLVGLWTTDDTLRKMVVSPSGDRAFTLSLSRDTQVFPTGRWAVVATSGTTGTRLWQSHRAWQAPPNICPSWRCRAGLFDIAVSPDGKRVYVTGSLQVTERNGDQYPLLNTNVVTMAFRASNGEKLWEKTYQPKPLGHRGEQYDLHSDDVGVSVVAGSSRVFVTGSKATTDGLYDLLAISYDATNGTQEWVTTYDTSTAGNPYALDQAAPGVAALTPNGKLLVSGASTCSFHKPLDPCAIFLVAFDATDGQRRWIRPLGIGGITTTDLGQLPSTTDDPVFLKMAPGGERLYVVGYRDRTVSSNPWTTMAVDPATGNTVWSITHTIRPSSFSVDPTGARLFMTSGQLVALDAATGQQRWAASPGGGLSGAGVSPDGKRVYVVGTNPAPATVVSTVLPQQATHAYDATSGTKLWIALYQREHEQEQARFVQVGGDGTVFTATQLPRVAESFTSWVPSRNRSNWGLQGYEP